LRSRCPPLIGDRPFPFAIRDRLSGTLLFLGKVVRPAWRDRGVTPPFRASESHYRHCSVFNHRPHGSPHIYQSLRHGTWRARAG
jgi:hypothetical protein